MKLQSAWIEITQPDELSAIIGDPTPRIRDKVRSTLSEIDRLWLSATPFCVVATADAAGRCDASPKGDPPGRLVHVLDDTTIALPDRPGNRRVDGYGNILENPHVGINFLIPGRGDTLRINGSARLVTDAAWFTELAVEARPLALALVVTVEEVFMHCAKAFLRARLWDPDSWDPEGIVPRPAVIAQHTHRPDETLEALDAHYARNYAGVLY